MKKTEQKRIEVWAHWSGISEPTMMGMLYATPSRGKELFSFEYAPEWIKSQYAQNLDPALGLYGGQQYAPEGQDNFGMFLDSSPDRWGRTLMQRREEQMARKEKREKRTLLVSDYLLGVYDGHRMGGLRFRTSPKGLFLDNERAIASPPWASLRELEHASLELEKDEAERNPEYSKWLAMLISPGSSLGGARPKASVLDEKERLWIAKFPSRHDEVDVGAWEAVVHKLAVGSGLSAAEALSRVFGARHNTFLTRRFDRNDAGERIHFASAMTLLQRSAGDDASRGASYLELVEFLIKRGSSPTEDLEELWRRIVFFICVSNVDDHLCNHGFILDSGGWRLAPSYDMNPVAAGDGLKLNISESDNAQDLELAKEVAPYFRIKADRADEIIHQVVSVVKTWKAVANSLSIPNAEQDRMASAFRVANKF